MNYTTDFSFLGHELKITSIQKEKEEVSVAVDWEIIVPKDMKKIVHHAEEIHDGSVRCRKETKWAIQQTKKWR